MQPDRNSESDENSDGKGNKSKYAHAHAISTKPDYEVTAVCSFGEGSKLSMIVDAPPR